MPGGQKLKPSSGRRRDCLVGVNLHAQGRGCSPDVSVSGIAIHSVRARRRTTPCGSRAPREARFGSYEHRKKVQFPSRRRFVQNLVFRFLEARLGASPFPAFRRHTSILFHFQNRIPVLSSPILSCRRVDSGTCSPEFGFWNNNLISLDSLLDSSRITPHGGALGSPRGSFIALPSPLREGLGTPDGQRLSFIQTIGEQYEALSSICSSTMWSIGFSRYHHGASPEARYCSTIQICGSNLVVAGIVSAGCLIGSN